MSARPFKPQGMPQLLPYLTVIDGQKTIDFYTKAFGFSLMGDPATNEQGQIQHVEMQFGEDVVVMFAPEGSWGSPRKAPASLGVSPSLVLYVYCKDVDKLHKQAIENGAIETMPLNDAFWGDRCCGFIDPDGHEWTFATNIADHK